MTDPLLDPLRRELSLNLLRWAIGRAIFCPGRHCGGAVLDVRRAVLFGTTVVCDVCWKATPPDDQAKILEVCTSADDPPIDGAALHGLAPLITR